MFFCRKVPVCYDKQRFRGRLRSQELRKATLDPSDGYSPMILSIYGIPNCDSVQKARKWLDANQVSYHFTDLRKETSTQKHFSRWLDILGPQKLVNRRSTTWKTLSVLDRSKVDNGSALEVLIDNPTLMKRPLIEYSGNVLVGFSEKTYAEIFSPSGWS